MEKTLQALKVPELKAKCKEVSFKLYFLEEYQADDVKLKIPNFSKLSKADLIAKILGASHEGGTDSTHTTQLPNTAGQSNLKAARPASGGNTEPKEDKGKEGKVVKKRKATDQAGPPTRESAAPRFIASDTPPIGEPVPAAVTTAVHAVSSTPASSIQPVQPAPPPKPKPIKKTTVTSSTTQTSSAPPKPTTQAKAIPKPQSTSRPPIAQKPQAIPKPQTVKTAVNTAATSKTKSKAVALPIKHAVKPKFRPLVQIQPVQAIIQATRPEETIIDLSTLTARIKFTESHFLNTLFTYLHKYRAKSITGPQFPCPPSFSKSKIYPQISHLAFQGFHPDIYNSDSDAFQAAIRFWLARMHSYMQLGSGEAWSSRAGGMGMLGPDMATWPPILKVEKVAGEVWAISTQEEEGEIKYLVIGEIGEVVASSKGAKGDEELIHGCIVRSDWARYLAGSTQKNFMSMVKSKESYDFPGGIAKAWSAKQSEGSIKIANRAVLASCALNR